MTSKLAAKVSLFMRGIGLKLADTFSKNDPFVVVYMKSKPGTGADSGAWQEVYRSETVQNTSDPVWATPFVVDYYFEEVQEVRFEVYDRDSKNENLKKQDFLGACEMKLGRIMGAVGSTHVEWLQNKKGEVMKNGRFQVTGEEVAMTKDICEFLMKGSKLKRKNMMGLGRSDPFYRISKETPDGSFVTVFESEVIKSTTKPEWKSQQIPVQLLCNGEYDKRIKFEIYDYESNGTHKFIGLFLTTLEALKETRKFDIFDENGKDAGDIEFSFFGIIKKYSFLEYIQGGCELKLTIAVDFTGSNKPAHEEGSLHYIPPDYEYTGKRNDVSQMNEYQKAMLAVGEILLDYDSDKHIPLYGFGASLSTVEDGEKMDPHCFPLTLDPNNVEVEGLGGVMKAYAEALTKVGLSGPTFFEKILGQVLSQTPDATQWKQFYNVILILTDGMINDMGATLEKVIDATGKPISIIIVGVGNADFAAMEELDNDAGKKLQYKGKVAQRDIVQFVPFRKFHGQSYTLLAEETLNEIPKQMEQYFNMVKITPNPKKDPKEVNFQG